METNTIVQLQLAREFWERGEHAVSRVHDPVSVSTGVVLLQDAVEAALWAVVQAKGLEVKGDKTAFMPLLRIVTEAAGAPPLAVLKDLEDLNTLRVGVKHKGILVHPPICVRYPMIVGNVLESVCERFFNCSISDISLIHLIGDQRVRASIESAKRFLVEGNMEEAVKSLSTAMFWTCENSSHGRLFQQLLDGHPKRYYFNDTQSIEYYLQLLEAGVDTASHRAFKSITPQAGWDDDTKEVIFAWDGWGCNPESWTPENIERCIDHCIDSAIKLQMFWRNPIKSQIASMTHTWWMYPTEPEVEIWNKNPHPPTSGSAFQIDEEARVLRVMKRDERMQVSRFHKPNEYDGYFIVEHSSGHFGWVARDSVKFEWGAREKSEDSSSSTDAGNED